MSKHLPKILLPVLLLLLSLNGYAGIFNWTGTTSSDWNTGSNWKNSATGTTGVVPGALDIADIGVVAFTGSQPAVSASTSCAGIIFGNATAVTLTVNTGATLTDASSFINTVPLTLVVNGTLQFSANFTNSGTVTQTGSGTLSIAGILTNSGVYNQSGTGSLTLTASNISNSGTINQTSSGSISVTHGSLVNSSVTSSLVQTGSGSITIAGFVSNFGTIKQNNGPLSVGGAFTNSGTSSAFIQTGSGTVSITGKTTNGGTFTQASGAITLGFDFVTTGTLNLGSANFSIAGDYTNSGTFTAGTGTCIFNDPGTIALKDNGNGTIFNNLELINSNTNTIQSGNFGIKSTGVLTLLNTGTKLVISSSATFTLYSDANGSASVAQLPTNGSITGNVAVQRYMSAFRGYRLMSSPVYASTVGTNNVYSINYLKGSVPLTGTNGVAGGFDKTGNPTLYLFRENLAPQYTTFLNSNFRGINNINTSPTYGMDDTTYPTTNIPIGNGYLFYYRGSLHQSSLATLTTVGATPTTDTLTTTGTLNQGNITVANWYTPSSTNLGFTTVSGSASVEGNNLIGNPYACSIDWDQYGSGIQETNIAPFCYQLVLAGQGAGNYNVYKAGSASKVGTQGNTNSNIIASGQGFFIFATGTGASLTFTELAKTTLSQNTGTNLYMAHVKNLASINDNDRFLRLQIEKDSINTDGIIVQFNDNAKASFNMMEDARYHQGTGVVSLSSLSSDNIPLAINQLPLSPKGDTIYLKTSVSAYGNYILNMKTIQGIPQYYNVWLKDAFLKDSVNMRTTNTYSFTVTTDTNSYHSKRFSLVLSVDPSYTYKLISFDANKIDRKNEVELVWKTQNEQNFINF
ncbi:MAG: beta strand repeat-containing protein, partial [Mucilaginibacter sp.]